MALEVNGAYISAAEVRSESARLRSEVMARGQEVTLELAIELTNEAEQLLIERVLLDEEAIRLGIVIRPEEVDSHTELPAAEMRAEIERRLRVDRLVELWTKSLKAPSSRAIRQVYAEERESFRVPELLLVDQIVKNVHHPDEREGTRAAMEFVAQALAEGGDFAELAGAHSDCPEHGGALGYIARGEMVPEFEDVVFALPLHQLSAVFESRFGFHLARVTERKPAGVLPLSEAAPRISSAMMEQAKELLVTGRLKLLHARASVRRVTP